MFRSKRKNKCQSDLAEFPKFLRFDEVKLCYESYDTERYGLGPSIYKRCQLLLKYLQPVKEALNDSNLIHFVGDIDDNNPRRFRDHSQLLYHLQKYLLPICDSSRNYIFQIDFNSEMEASGI